MPEQLDIKDTLSREITWYVATPIDGFRAVMRYLEMDFRNYTFIDVGSGMGRVVLLASQYPFHTVIGIELSKDLHEVAVKNLKRYRNTRRSQQPIQLVCADILHFDFPPGDKLIFLFNPFGAKMVWSLLEKLRESIETDNSNAVVVYFNDVHADVFEQTSWLCRKSPVSDSRWLGFSVFVSQNNGNLDSPDGV